jgi:uncharacterized protein YecE (DUF72 family)
MSDDSILREIRAVREEYARSHDFNVHKIVADLRQTKLPGDWKFVRLPPRPPRATAAAATANPPTPNTSAPMTIYVGTSGYSYKEWKGSFYPADLPAKKMLHFYGERFRAVESNYTFNNIPDASVLEGWTSQVPADFLFALKAPQQITHRKRLNDADDLVAEFIDVAGVLKKRLGPILFQLPPNFKKDSPRLKAFLRLMPQRCRVAFEFRHQSWFDDEVFGLLRKHRAALCIADAEDDLEVPFWSTADWGYLRLRRPKYSTSALKTWAKKVREQKWREALVFFKHEDEGKGPKFAKQFLKLAG